MLQSIFPFKDNKVFFILSYCAHQIAKREDEVLQWTFTEELKEDVLTSLSIWYNNSKLVSF